MKTATVASILGAVSVAATAFAGPPANAAQSQTSEDVVDVAQTRTLTNLDTKTIAEADKLVSNKGGLLVFDEKSASMLSSREKYRVRGAVAEWNRNVQELDGAASSGVASAHAETQGAKGKVQVVKGKHGYIEAHWWGLKIHVDSYLKGKIQGGAAGAAAIATGIGLATSETGVGGVAGAVVSVALSGASAVIGICSEEDGGVTFYEPISGGPPVCNPLG